MNAELSKFITEVPIKAHGAVGIGVGGTAGTSLILDLFNTWLSVAALSLGIVVTALSAISLFYKIRQEKIKAEREKIKAERDSLELEMYRKQIQGVAQQVGERK